MFKRIYFFFFTYMGAMYFSQTLIVFWLYKNGFSFTHITAYYLISYIATIISIFALMRMKIDSKKALFLGVLLSVLSVAIIIDVKNSYQLYLSAAVGGINVVFFWITYNIMHFKFSKENKRGLNSGMYYIISPIISITLQPIAGIVAEKFGFTIMFIVGISLYLIPLVLIRFLPSFELNLNARKELLLSKINWSTLLQGFNLRISYSLIPIFTLFFIKTPKAFGGFLGYLAIFAAIASLINASISDRIKSRKVFFYLFTTLAVLSFLPLAFIENLYIWAIFVGLSSLFICLANPFWLVFNLDYYNKYGIDNAIILREIFLNIGYLLTILITIIIFYFSSSTKISLMVVSIIACILPVASYLQGVYKDRKI